MQQYILSLFFHFFFSSSYQQSKCLICVDKLLIFFFFLFPRYVFGCMLLLTLRETNVFIVYIKISYSKHVRECIQCFLQLFVFYWFKKNDTHRFESIFHKKTSSLICSSCFSYPHSN